jgi:hypothetical protein
MLESAASRRLLRRMSYEGVPPIGTSPEDASRFEHDVLEHVRRLLSPGSALSHEMLSGTEILSIELTAGQTPVEIVVTLDEQGKRREERFAVWGLDDPPPDPHARHEAREVASIIAANVVEF